MDAEPAQSLTREAFERQRAAATRVARRYGRLLALSSVGLGVAQLVFLRWADMHLARGQKLAIAGPAFIAYMVVIGVLLWRMERKLRSVRPVCPHCRVALKGMSERLAFATGKCDSCGGWILKQEERQA